MNIVVRTDSSTVLGNGHIMRCLTLAKALEQQFHAKIYFICKSLPGNYTEQVKEEKHHVLLIPDKLTNEHQDAEETIKHLPPHTELLIIDHYELGANWHHQLSSYSNKIMVIDDLCNRQLHADIVLNQNPTHTDKDYQPFVKPNTQLLLGSHYALLRPQFTKLHRTKTHNGKVKKILISMGGTDIVNATKFILIMLSQSNYSDKVEVILAKNAPHIEEIKQLCDNYGFSFFVDIKNMAQHLIENDLVIGAPGGTSWERCCLGIPSMLLTTADNQVEVATYLDKHGAAQVAGTYPGISLTTLLLAFESLINQPNKIKSLNKNSLRLCDGKGATRVADKIGMLLSKTNPTIL